MARRGALARPPPAGWGAATVPDALQRTEKVPARRLGHGRQGPSRAVLAADADDDVMYVD